MCPGIGNTWREQGSGRLPMLRSEFQQGENTKKIPECLCVGVFALGTWRLSFQNVAFARPFLAPQGAPLGLHRVCIMELAAILATVSFP